MQAALARARLVLDILSMKLFVWLVGRNGELLDSHLFFYHRYTELAALYDAAGRTAVAHRLLTIAEAHYRAAPGDDDPPDAAAMAMPVPRPPIITDAVSSLRVEPSPMRRHPRLAPTQ